MSSDSGSSPVSSGMNSTALGGRMSTIFNGGVSAVVGRVSSSVATTSFDGRSSGGMTWAPSSSALPECSELGVTIISTGSGSNIGAVSYSRYRFYQWSRFYSITLSDNVRAVYSIAMCVQILNNLFTR